MIRYIRLFLYACLSFVLSDQALADSFCKDFKWTPAGHGHLVSIAANFAGRDDAKELAYYTQAPDREALSFSAPAVAIWGVFRPAYRNRVMTVLHSLHGGKAKEVTDRQKKLGELVREYVESPTEPRWKAGFLLHALGDSYAHTHVKDGQLKAYNQWVGHAFDHDGDADNMSKHFFKYLETANATFDAISPDGVGREKFDKFLLGLEKLSKEGADQKRLEMFVTETDETPISNFDCDELAKELSVKKVTAFLKEIKSRL